MYHFIVDDKGDFHRVKPEIEGATEACNVCRDQEKKLCYVLKTLKQLGLFYKGKCGRDTKDGVILADRPDPGDAE